MSQDAGRTLGVAEEFHLVDPETLAARARFPPECAA
jgi:hypothetical protein